MTIEIDGGHLMSAEIPALLGTRPLQGRINGATQRVG
jgi:hypothetical protein